MATLGRNLAALAFLSLLAVTDLVSQNNSLAQRLGGIPLGRRAVMPVPGVAPTQSIGRQEREVSYIGVRRLVPSQYPTIQAAIDSAKSGDTVLVSENTYKEIIRFRGKGIILASLYLLDSDTSHVRRTVIDGSGATNPDSGSVVSFVNGEDTTSVLCGFTITGGTGTNAMFTYDTGTFAARVGGGVFCHLSGSRIVGNLIARNRIVAPVGSGGGVEIVGSSLSTPSVIIEKNRIVDNSVTGTIATGDFFWSTGGGIDVTGAACRAMYNTIERDSVVSANGAYGGGMALTRYFEAAAPKVTALFTGNTFRANVLRSTRQGAVGAGLLVGGTGDVTIADNLFEDNSATSSGSGTWAQAGGLNIDDEGNVTPGEKLIRNNRFLGNTVGCLALNDGGGIELWQTVATLSGNVFQGNSVTGAGTGAYGTPGGGAGVSAYASSFRMENNIFRKNASAKDAAGLLIAGAPVKGTGQVLVNNTFSDNNADGVGGAMRIYLAPNVVAFNNVLWNDAGKFGGNEIAYDGSDPVLLYSDIQGWLSGIGILNTNPVFADSTMKLSPGSPCLGRGRDSIQVSGTWYHAPVSDIYGSSRPAPAGSFPDIGAVESPLRETRSRPVPGQYATIQAAIDAAAHGDTVLVSENTYKENIHFRGKHITVASQYLVDGDSTHIAKTIIDGSAPTSPDTGSTVSLVNGEDTTSVLCGFTIRGGSGTNMTYYWGTTPYSIRAGGGIFCNLAGARIVKNIITRNIITAPYPTGGGVEVYGSTTVTPVLILEANRIIDNVLEATSNATSQWASSAGADFCGANGRIVNNVFERDTARGYEGAYGGGFGVTFYSIYSPLVSVQVTGNIVRANVARGTIEGAVGGGALIQGTANMTIADNVFEGNTAVCSGGWGEGGGLCLTDQDEVSYGRKLIENNQFLNNTASCGNTNDGGGLFLYKTYAVVSRNRFKGNMVTAGGRGSENTPGGGAGMSAFRSSFKIENNIFQKNKSAVDAGGLVVSFSPQVGIGQAIVNNTFTGNVADGVGGAMRVYLAPATVLLNTICWRDSGAKGGNEIAEDGGFAAVANCDIQGGWTSSYPNWNWDPLFVDTLRLELSAGSKCVGHGADSLQVGGIWYRAPLVDIYGNPRGPVGTHVDIGAVEELLVSAPIPAPEVPIAYALHQNFPNPFNPSTVVGIQLPVASRVKLVVYNLLGQQVAVLMDEKKDPGHYEVRWNATGMPSGVYFYRLEAGEFKDVKKMVLLK